MKTKTIRIPDEMIDAIELVEKEEKIEESTAMRKLMRIGFETYVGNLYKDGKITMRRAARLLHMNQVELINFFQDSGIKGNLDASDVLTSLNRFVKQRQ